MRARRRWRDRKRYEFVQSEKHVRILKGLRRILQGDDLFDSSDDEIKISTEIIQRLFMVPTNVSTLNLKESWFEFEQVFLNRVIERASSLFDLGMHKTKLFNDETGEHDYKVGFSVDISQLRTGLNLVEFYVLNSKVLNSNALFKFF